MKRLRWIRATVLSVLTGYLILRPYLSAELLPRLGITADLTALISAFLLVALSGLRRLRALGTLWMPLGAWLAALIIGIALHGADRASLPDRLALVTGPLLLCAAATPWGAWRRRLLRGLLITAIVISCLALWQVFVILPAMAAQQRAIGTFSLATLLAGYLGLMLPLGVHQVRRVWQFRGAGARVIATGTLLILAAAWLLTKSVGGWASLTLGCCVVWLGRRYLREVCVGGGVLLVLGGCMLLTRPDLWHVSSGHHPVVNRLVYWDAAWQLVQQHPIVGIGSGGFARAYPLVTSAPALGVRHAHNTFLEVWAEWGLGGLVAWGWLIVSLLWRARWCPPWLAIPLWVLPLHNLTDFSWYVPQVSMLWWYLAGWGLKRHWGRHKCSSQNPLGLRAGDAGQGPKLPAADDGDSPARRGQLGWPAAGPTGRVLG